MEIIRPESSAYSQGADIYSWASEIDEGAYLQAVNLSNLPFLFKHVALMPDVHQGYGMPIGGVIACKDVVIPNAVGVDIGCGMVAVETNLSIYDFPQEELTLLLEKIHDEIRSRVPVGFKVHHEIQSWNGFEEYIQGDMLGEEPRWMTAHNRDRMWRSLGTLGGGNHFIEIQRETGSNGEIWIMIHSGSRNLGKTIADYYHKLALEKCSDWYSNLPDPHLAFLPTSTEFGKDYIRDMNFALRFAHENRQRMLQDCKDALQEVLPENTEFGEEINIHHNYANLENSMGKNVWVHRKGATSAKEGQLGIIPGSMGTASYIVEGKGNPLSFMSCSHGAGRRMGRMEACRSLKEEECTADMGDVIFGGWGKVGRGKMKNEADLGEAPRAYKNIDEVIENQRDLVEVRHRLLPLAVVKG